MLRFYAHESCGKCTPCREGGTWMEAHPRPGHRVRGTDGDLDRLFAVGETICPGAMPHAASERLRLGDTVPYKMTTICFLGPSAYVPVHSAVTLFRDEFEAKIKPRDDPGGCCRRWVVTATEERPDEETAPPDPNAIAVTIDGRAIRGPRGRTRHRRRPAPRHLHPEVLLARADEPGRDVPDVPRRRRHWAGTDAAAVVHGHRLAGHEGGDRVSRGQAPRKA